MTKQELTYQSCTKQAEEKEPKRRYRIIDPLFCKHSGIPLKDTKLPTIL